MINFCRMKNMLLALMYAALLSTCASVSENTDANIITTDIDHFWTAYDKIRSSSDSTQQLAYLQHLFLDQASLGQRAMIEAKYYLAQDYLQAINQYPNFWDAVREHMTKSVEQSKDLQIAIEQLRKLYPALKPAKIYFTVGALRSNGTTMDSLVLIGSELVFTDKNTPTEEFTETLAHLPAYFAGEPINNMVFLITHEYIHTQQATTSGNTLLAQTVIEGVAEFLAEKVLDQTSPNPQIAFGLEHDAAIKAAYVTEMFSPYLFNWIWNSPNNAFGMRDLAYYVGYRICREYYDAATDKSAAIRQMIELDYDDEEQLIRFVEQSGYFAEPLINYKIPFEEKRPTVIGITPFENGYEQVKTEVDELVVHFSQPMHTALRNFELGPSGEANLLKISRFIGFSEDARSIRFKIDPLKPNRTYELVIGSGFQNADGVPLKPFLITFKTAGE